MRDNKRSTSTDISRPGPNKKYKYNADMSSEILSTVQEYFKRPQSTIDCCELLGKTVATKMRNIKGPSTLATLFSHRWPRFCGGPEHTRATCGGDMYVMYANALSVAGTSHSLLHT